MAAKAQGLIVLLFIFGLANALWAQTGQIKALKDMGDGFNTASVETQNTLSKVISDTFSLKMQISSIVDELEKVRKGGAGDAAKHILEMIKYSKDLEKIITDLNERATDLLAVQDRIIASKQQLSLAEISFAVKEKKSVGQEDAMAQDLEKERSAVAKLENEKRELSDTIRSIEKDRAVLSGKLGILQEELQQVQKTVPDKVEEEKKPLQGKIDELALKVKDTESLLEEKGGMINQITAEKAELTKKLQEKEDVITALQKEVQSHKDAIPVKVAEETMVLEHKIRALNEELKKINDFMMEKIAEASAPLVEHNESLEKELKIREETFSKTLREVQEPLQEKIVTLGQALEDTKISISEKNILLENKESEMEKFRTRINLLHEENRSLKEEAGLLKGQVGMIRKESDQKLANVQKPLEEKAARLEERIKEMEVSVKQKESLIRSLAKEKDELAKKLASVDQAKSGLEDSLTGLHKQKQEQERLIREYEHKLSMGQKNLLSLKEELQNAQRLLSAE